MKLANAVVQHLVEDFDSGQRADLASIRIMPLEAESIATEADKFIPLAKDISIGEKTTVLSIQPVQLNKNPEPVNFAPAQGFTFELERFSRVAVVELSRKVTVHSNDPYKESSPEVFEQEVVLVPFDGDVAKMPLGSRFVSLLDVEGCHVSCTDNKTGQTYKLGFVFTQSAERIDWLALALERREHWIRGRKRDDSNAPSAFTSSYRFDTQDEELAALITSRIGYPGEKMSDGTVHFELRDSDDYETCWECQREHKEKKRASAKGWLSVTSSIGASGQAATQDVDVANYEAGE